MEFNLNYTCEHCKTKFQKLGFKRSCKIYKGKYYFYRCNKCSSKINYYKLYNQNRNKIEQIISLIIYNITEKKIQDKVTTMLKEQYIGYYKEIGILFDTVYNSIYDSIDMNRLINKIKEIDNKQSDKISYPNIKTLQSNLDDIQDNVILSEAENEIINLLIFDYNDYRISTKINNFLKENNKNKYKIKRKIRINNNIEED